MRSLIIETSLLLLSLGLPGTAQQTLKHDPPKKWTAQTPSSGMRLAQFVLPRAEGDPEDASAVIFFFGQGQGGSVDENLDRWAAQMAQPDGKPGTRQQAKIASFTVNGLKVTTLDASGAYAGGQGAGAQARPNAVSRMKAAVVETPGGNFFIRVLGPYKTVARWDTAVEQWFRSVRTGGRD